MRLLDCRLKDMTLEEYNATKFRRVIELERLITEAREFSKKHRWSDLSLYQQIIAKIDSYSMEIKRWNSNKVVEDLVFYKEVQA